MSSTSENKKNKIIADIIMGVCLLSFGLYFYLLSKNIRGEAAIFPKIILIALILLSIYFTISSIFNLLITQKIIRNEDGAKSLKGKEINLSNIWEKSRVEILTIIFYVLVLIYIIFLPIIGFEYASVIFVAVSMYIIDKKTLKKYFYTAIILPIILTILFRVLLRVYLPISKIPFIQ